MKLTIAGKEFSPKEYAGERVVAFADIDMVHQRATGTAARNFRENRGRFIEGTDYFVLSGDALREYKRTTNFVGRRINELHLITETGYLMLVKSFTDDLAWTVQRELVNSYFRVREVNPEPPKPKRPEVVDIPQNPQFQETFSEIRKNITTLDVLMQRMNRYLSPEEANAYVKAVDDIGINILKLTDSFRRMKFKLIPEPY